MSERPRVLVVEHQADGPLGRFEQPLRELTRLDLRRPYAGAELPAGLDGVAGLVVLGGAMGAEQDDRAPWLVRTRQLLRDAVAAGVPTLGICLGAQLLAVAAGGVVERGSAGPEIGLERVRVLPAAAGDQLFGQCPVGAELAVLHDHQDAVTRLPAGAVLLADGGRYRYQAFRVGPAAWGVQYHPEVTAAGFAGWIEEQRAELQSRGQDPDALLRQAAAAEADLAGLAAWHAQRFLGLLTWT